MNTCSVCGADLHQSIGWTWINDLQVCMVDAKKLGAAGGLASQEAANVVSVDSERQWREHYRLPPEEVVP